MPAMFFDRIAQSIAGLARSCIRLFLGDQRVRRRF